MQSLCRLGSCLAANLLFLARRQNQVREVVQQGCHQVAGKDVTLADRTKARAPPASDLKCVLND